VISSEAMNFTITCRSTSTILIKSICCTYLGSGHREINFCFLTALECSYNNTNTKHFYCIKVYHTLLIGATSLTEPGPDLCVSDEGVLHKSELILLRNLLL
jgi:hypothetical protein